MKRIPPISTLMTPFPWHLDVAGSVRDARDMMIKQDIHQLPITNEEHHVLGIVRLEALPDTDDPLAEWLEPVPTLDAHTRADEVLDLMAESHQPVVVLCHHKHLAGILTWTDVCRRYAEQLREPFLPPEGGDAA